MKTFLEKVVQTPHLHAKWLNTLSFLENCGARKIAACEHPTLVKEEMLKHAAEEFRHAHYLKRQIPKVSGNPFPSYAPEFLLGGFSTLHYLSKLELFTCRLLQKRAGELTYLLVTYAIEMRAKKLYPLYHEVLRKTRSKVHVKSILLEEEEHLEEMERGLAKHPGGKDLALQVCEIEALLYKNWTKTLFRKSHIGENQDENIGEGIHLWDIKNGSC